MNKEQCEYYADFLLAKAKGECVEYENCEGIWSEWQGNTCNRNGDYTVLRIKPEPLEYWMNMCPEWRTPTTYNSASDAILAAKSSTNNEDQYRFIAKRFVGDL